MARATGEVRWFELTDAAITRIWSKITVRGADDCWPWKRGRYRSGYGMVRVGGAGGSVFEASRVVYAIATGEVGPGTVVRHSCDNPPCCNPAHLIGGTTQDNVLDAIERGRMTFRAPEMVQRECPVCGVAFTTRRSHGTKLCGKRSCEKIRRRRALERQGRNANGTFGTAA